MPKLKKISCAQRNAKDKIVKRQNRSIIEVEKQLPFNIEGCTKESQINEISRKKRDLKRKSEEINFDKIIQTDVPFRLLLPKRKFIESDGAINELSKTIEQDTDHSDNDIINDSDNDNDNDICTLPDIIFGDFSQYSNEFPKPQTQCTAKAIIAFAYASLKSVALWNANDLNSILRIGQNYYENCMSHLLQSNPTYESTYLEPLHLLKNLEINSHQIEVFVESTQCRGGAHINGTFVDAIHNFEDCQFRNGIITYLGFSYGLLRFNINDISAYGLFDSHGRFKNTYQSEAKSVILCFKDSEDLINFFLNEHPLLSEIPKVDGDSDTEQELDEDLTNILNMWDSFSDFGISKDIDFINKAIDDLVKTNRFLINSETDVNQCEDVILKLNIDEIEEMSNRKIYYNIRSLISSTNNLHQKNKEWQLCLKMEKDRLREETIYGKSKDMSDYKTTNYITNFNDNNNIAVPDVIVGILDLTTQQSIISRYSLNEAQIRAFTIVTDHIEWNSYLKVNGNQQQLIMCVASSAGTGKSHLNKTLTEYFKITGRLSMLRKLAPTSVAANEMGEGGLTMQSFLNCRLPTIITSKRKSSIENEWRHIKYTFMDELSMMGLATLAKLSRLMSLAREDLADSNDPFGGKNIIFFGDPLQYDPIMDHAVYKNVLSPEDHLKNEKELLNKYLDMESDLVHKTSKKEENEKTQVKIDKMEVNILPKVSNKMIQQRVGRALWLQINTVVMLKDQMRTTDKVLLDIQNRIREGKVTEADYKELCKRVVGKGNEVESLTETPWKSAPIIMFRHDIKTIINRRAAILKANELKTPLIVCVANDTYSFKSNIKSDKIKEISRYILSLEDNKTENLCGYLPLVEGMPVMITRSLFTELGVSNGTIGIFKQLIYDDNVDDDINNSELTNKNIYPKNTIYIRKPVFALIELKHMEKIPKLNGLDDKIIPIPVIKEDFYISKMLPRTLRKSIKVCKVKVIRVQLPLVPSFSYTSHKSQGQTITNCILDLNFPPPPFKKELATIYVPLTRVKRREDLVFFRPFPISSLQLKPSKNQINDLERLEHLNEQTKKEFEKQYPK